MRWTWLALPLLLQSVACTVGDGKGYVRTKEEAGRLYLKECWNGPFDLKPDFFAANPYRGEQLMIRVQRGDNNEEASDGLLVNVMDLAAVKAAAKNGEAIPVGLPNGVAPPGQPLTGAENPKVTLALYLHQTCHEQNSATYSVSGSITFRSIFSGNPNEENSYDRLTDADFVARFADPRDLIGASDPEQVTSDDIEGHFHFYFQRGQPAQPFQ
jgi:hypothetical protein